METWGFLHGNGNPYTMVDDDGRERNLARKAAWSRCHTWSRHALEFMWPSAYGSICKKMKTRISRARAQYLIRGRTTTDTSKRASNFGKLHVDQYLTKNKSLRPSNRREKLNDSIVAFQANLSEWISKEVVRNKRAQQKQFSTENNKSRASEASRSEWISKRSYAQRTITAETIHNRKQNINQGVRP